MAKLGPGGLLGVLQCTMLDRVSDGQLLHRSSHRLVQLVLFIWTMNTLCTKFLDRRASYYMISVPEKCTRLRHSQLMKVRDPQTRGMKLDLIKLIRIAVVDYIIQTSDWRPKSSFGGKMSAG